MVKKIIKIIREKGLLFPLKKYFNFFILFPFPYILIKIKKFNPKNIDELVDFVFNEKLIKPCQISEEISKLLIILKENKPKNILEIGTARGGTLFCFCKILQENGIIISIDLPQGKFGGGYPVWKIPFYSSFVKPPQKIHLIRDDSHKNRTLEKLKIILGNEKIDFLFIDSDHTYEGVKKDFQMYESFVKKGGMIGFHDIILHSSKSECEVDKFWDEIKKEYKYREIVKNNKQEWAGIGIILKQ